MSASELLIVAIAFALLFVALFLAMWFPLSGIDRDRERRTEELEADPVFRFIRDGRP